MKFQKLHEDAVRLSKDYFRAEAELLDILQKIDAEKAFREFQCTSLYQYAVTVLKLSEATAYNFINVARKAVQIPELKTEIDNGNLSIAKARKIVPVLSPSDSQENQREWIEKAKTLSSRKLEQAVAKVAPKEETPESSKFITETRRALKLGMEETDFQNLKRVQDLESQRQKRAVSMEEAIAVVTKFYLQSKDPLVKAERSLVKMRNIEVRATPKKRVSLKSLNEFCDKDQPIERHVECDLEVPTENFSKSGFTRAIDSKHVTGQVETSLDMPPGFFIESRFGANAPIKKRIPIPARELHQVRLRDQAQCTHNDSQNGRCEQRRWLEIHHVKPVSRGGKNEVTNLTTLCFSHHRQRHCEN